MVLKLGWLGDLLMTCYLTQLTNNKTTCYYFDCDVLRIILFLNSENPVQLRNVNLNEFETLLTFYCEGWHFYLVVSYLSTYPECLLK